MDQNKEQKCYSVVKVQSFSFDLKFDIVHQSYIHTYRDIPYTVTYMYRDVIHHDTHTYILTIPSISER